MTNYFKPQLCLCVVLCILWFCRLFFLSIVQDFYFATLLIRSRGWHILNMASDSRAHQLHLAKEICARQTFFKNKKEGL